MNSAIALIIALNVCHWIGDYTHASRPWMLMAKRTGSPLGPIMLHALVHAALMAAVCLAMVSPMAAAMCFVVQLITHFAIDVLKGRMNVWVPVLKDPAKYPHWYVFGADQFAHQLVILCIVLLSTSVG